MRNSNIDFLNFYNDAMNNSIGDFITVLNFVDDGDYSAAQKKLNMIVCSSQIELKLKDVLSIFINSKINNEDYSIQDIETLQNVAYQIPKEGGPAVYLARAILNSEMDDANGTGRFGNNQTNVTNYYFELSPNPANDLLRIVNYKTDKSFQVEIVDLYGKVVLSKTFDGNLQQQLNISELKSAIYFAGPAAAGNQERHGEGCVREPHSWQGTRRHRRVQGRGGCCLTNAGRYGQPSAGAR